MMKIFAFPQASRRYGKTGRQGENYTMRPKHLVAVLLLLLMCGCQSTYYSVMESFGKEKRHLLRDQVEKVRVEQEGASEQFKDALARIKEAYGFDGGDLEEFYEKLKQDYDGCERRADAVKKRILRVERIAGDLFAEWETEIGRMENPRLKAGSRASLEETRISYARLSSAMSQAESRMEPALSHLRDYVLYLKHNLNARAIGALKQEADGIEVEVAALLRDMSRSIRKADEFLKVLE